MTKKYYQTLRVDEKATPEDIKKSYRKLAQQWHPDKWSGKSLKEREQANETMQKVNKAYEILGDAEKRERYDLGLTDFPTDNFDYDPKEEVRRQEEELRRSEIHIADLELEILKLEMKALDRSSTLSEIGAAFCFSLPRVHAEDLDPVLWQPYQSWGEKVVKMEIAIPKGKDRSEELKKFKEEMVKAIKEAETTLQVREENKKKNEVDFELNQARTVAFQEIEKSINERDLKVKDLGQYANYQERINSLGEVWGVRNFREEVLNFISKLTKKEPEPRRQDNYRPLNNPYHQPGGQFNYWVPNNNNNSPNFLSDNSRPRENPNYQSWPNPNPRLTDRLDLLKTEPERVFDRRDEPRGRIEEGRMDNFSSGIRDNKYDNWTHQELVDEIKRERLTNDRLNKHISFLESKNKKLEEAVQALKVTTPQTSWIKQTIFGKEKQSNQSKMALNLTEAQQYQEVPPKTSNRW